MLPPFQAADYATMTALFGAASILLKTEKPLWLNGFSVSKRVDEISAFKNAVFTYVF
jgi:hypothetical protein